jgi:hypothetical protein
VNFLSDNASATWRIAALATSRVIIRPWRLPEAVWAVLGATRLRRQRWTGKQIADETGVSPASVSRVLRRLGLNAPLALEPAELIRRYERENPGELQPLGRAALMVDGQRSYACPYGFPRNLKLQHDQRQGTGSFDVTRVEAPRRQSPQLP